jgi:hypothetical protein
MTRHGTRRHHHATLRDQQVATRVTTRWKHGATLRDGQFSDEFTQVVPCLHDIERTGLKETGTFRPAGAERNYWPTTLSCHIGSFVYQKTGRRCFPKA